MAAPGGGRIHTPARTAPEYGIHLAWKAVLGMRIEQLSVPLFLPE